MPVYDYLCTACDHRADILHGINDPGPHFCPSCGSEGTMRKQFAAPAVHFKGSGWAKKDRGSASSTRAAARSSSSESSGDGTKDGRGDGAKEGTSAPRDGAKESTSAPRDGGGEGSTSTGASPTSTDAPKQHTTH